MTEDKFLELVQEHQAQIYQHTLYLLGNREDAEDITQETFIKAWEHRAKLRLKTVRSWLLKCAQNLCFNLLKRRKFQEPLTEGDETELEMLLHRDTRTGQIHCLMKLSSSRNLKRQCMMLSINCHRRCERS